MSPRARMIVIAGAAAALAAGGTVALAVVTASRQRGPPSRQASRSQASHRSCSTSASASIPRHGRSGGPSASTTRSGTRRPAGSSRATTRRRRRSAPRSLRGRARAWRRSSSLARERPTKLARAPPPRVRQSLGGPQRGGEPLPGGRLPRRSPTPPRRSGPTPPCTRTSRRASRSSFRASRRRPGLRALSPPDQLAALAAEARRPGRPREAPLRARAAAARPPALGSTGVRRGREARAARPGGARRSGGLALRQEPAGGGFLPPRPAHAALSEGRDRALSPRAAAPLARPDRSRARSRRAKRQLRLAQRAGAGLSARAGSKKLLAGLEDVQTPAEAD